MLAAEAATTRRSICPIRLGHRPCGRMSIKAMRPMPNANIRTWSNARSASGRMTMTAAPRITPGRLPMPPRMMTIRIVTDWMKVKLEGLIAVSFTAKNEPAAPAKTAPST